MERFRADCEGSSGRLPVCTEAVSFLVRLSALSPGKFKRPQGMEACRGCLGRGTWPLTR